MDKDDIRETELTRLDDHTTERVRTVDDEEDGDAYNSTHTAIRAAAYALGIVNVGEHGDEEWIGGRTRIIVLRNLWAIVLLFPLLYDATFIPFRVAFLYRTEYVHWTFIVLDVITDIIFWIDVIIRIHVLYHNNNSNNHMYHHTMRQASHNSLKSFPISTFDRNKCMVWIDVLGSLPYDIFALVILRKTWLAPYRLPRLIRLHRLVQCSRALETVYETWTRGFHPGTRRLIRLGLLYIVCDHIATCAFYLLHRIQQDTTTTWLSGDFAASQSLIDQFIASFYWTTNVMTLNGFGDIVVKTFDETVLCTIVMFIGFILSCAVVANLTSMISSYNTGENMFRRQFENVLDYVKYRKLDNELVQRVSKYYSYMWRQFRGINENELLDDLPSSLRTQVAQSRTRDVIRRIPAFLRFDIGFLNELASSMQSQLYSPGMYILKPGDVSDCMYVLGEGTCEKRDDANTLLCIMKEGELFNQAALFFTKRISIYIVAQTYCEIFYISRHNFHQLIKHHFKRSVSKSSSDSHVDDHDKNMSNQLNAVLSQLFGIQHKTSTRSSNRPSRQFVSLASLFAYKLSPKSTNVKLHKASTLLPKPKDRYGDDDDDERDPIYDEDNGGDERVHSYWYPESMMVHIWISCRMIFIIRHAYICTLGMGYINKRDYLYNYSSIASWLLIIIPDIIAAVFFMIDVALQYNCICRFNPQTGVLLTGIHEIRANYMESYGVHMEIISSIPIDLITLLSLQQSYLQYTPLLSCIHLLRIVKFQMYLNEFNELPLIRQLDISYTVKRIVKIVSVGSLLVHIVACGWTYLGTIEGWKATWIIGDITTHYGLWTYIRSVYYALGAFTTIAYGEIRSFNSAERVYTIFMMLIGSLTYPAALGGLAVLIINLDSRRVEFKKLRNELKSYMFRNNIPMHIRKEAIQFNEYLWHRQKGAHEQCVLNELTDSLRLDVVANITLPILKKIPLFASCPPDFLRGVMAQLRPRSFVPNEIIVKDGDLPNALYLLIHGSIVKENDGQAQQLLGDGSFFGEQSLIPSDLSLVSERTYQIRALRYCDCFLFPPNSMKKYLDLYPECKALLKSQCSKMMRSQDNESPQDTVPIRALTKRISQTIHKPHKARGNMGAHDIPARIILPESSFRLLWEIACLILLIYNAIVIPIQLLHSAISLHTPLGWGILIWLIFDCITDIFYWMDIYLRYKLFAYVYSGEVIVNSQSISNHYKKHDRMWLDVIACLPIDIPAYFIGGFPLLLTMRGLHILRLHRLYQHFHYVIVYIERRGALTDSNGDTPTFMALLRVIVLQLGVLLVAHWFACMFLGLALYQQRSGAYTWIDDQVKDGHMSVDASLFAQYLRSYYWSLSTIVALVIGDIHAGSNIESLFSVFTIVIGISTHAVVIAIVGEIVADLNTHSSQHSVERDEIELYMEQHDLPPDLRFKVRDYNRFRWNLDRGQNSQSLLSFLPSKTLTDIRWFERQTFFINDNIMECIPLDKLKLLAVLLEEETFAQNQTVYSHGNRMDAIRFVLVGQVASFTPVGNFQVTTFNEHCIIDPFWMFLKQSTNLDYRTLTHTRLLKLSHDKFDDFILEHNLLDAYNNTIVSESKRRLANLEATITSTIHNLRTQSKLQKRFNLVASNSVQMSRGAQPSTNDGIVNYSSLNVQSSILDDEYDNSVPMILSSPIQCTTQSFPSTIFMPLSSFRQVWNVIAFTLCIYNLIVLPVRVSFLLDINASIPNIIWFAIELILMDGFFWLDMWLHMTRFAFYDNGQLIQDQYEISQNYEKVYLFNDLLSNLPYTLIAIVVAPNNVMLWSIVRLNKLARAFTRLSVYIKRLNEHMDVHKVIIGREFRRVLIFTFIYLLTTHWFACMWFSLARLEGGATASFPTWANKDKLFQTNFFVQYTRTFYYVLSTISSTGFGDIRPWNNIETGMAFIVLIGGSTASAALIAVITAKFDHEEQRGQNRFYLHLSDIYHYLKLRKLSPKVCEDVVRHAETTWNARKGVKPSVINDLPQSVQLEIAKYTQRKLIERINIFKNADERDVLQLIAVLRPRFVRKKSWIFCRHESADEIYFLYAGTAKQIDEFGQTVVEYGAGSHFGHEEFSIHHDGNEHKTNVQATHYCELHILEKNALKRILERHPELEHSELVHTLLNVTDSLDSNHKTNVYEHTKEIIETQLTGDRLSDAEFDRQLSREIERATFKFVRSSTINQSATLQTRSDSIDAIQHAKQVTLQHMEKLKIDERSNVCEDDESKQNSTHS